MNSDAKQASKDAGVYTYSRLAGSVFVLLTLALGARIYSTAEFAYISALLLLYESAVSLGNFGLPDSVFYLIGKHPERAPQVVRQTSLLLLVGALPVIAIVWAFGAGMEREIAIAPSLPWLALTLLVELPTQPAINQLLAVGHARLASALFLGFAAFRPIAVLVPALTGVSVTWIPVVMAISGAARLIAHVWIVGGMFPLGAVRTWIDRQALRAIAVFAFPAGLAALSGKLSPQIDKYVVQIVRGSEDFVLYTAAAWELPLVTLVPYAIGAVMQARYVRLYLDRRPEELRALWHQTVRKTALIVLPLTMMLIALGREAVIVVAGERYADAAPLFQIFTAVMLARVASYGSMLQSIGETRSLLVTSTLMLVTNLVLSYPFTLLFGFPGAAIATACANVPSLLFALWRISVGLQTNLRGVMPWRAYLATLAVAAVIAVGTWALVQVLPLGAGARLALGATAYVTAFLIIGRLVRLMRTMTWPTSGSG